MTYSADATRWIEQQARRKQREVAGVAHPTHPLAHAYDNPVRYATYVPNTDPRVAKWQRNWGHN